MTDVYDLENLTPNPNFFVNGVLVHNCPFSCTFCDWGSATFQKVKRFGDERILKEFDWFADRKIELLYNCDANAGQFDRDVGLIRKLVEVKERTGYPQKFRASYAKNSHERVFQITKLLNDAGMNKGATISFQSLSETTLETVKRKNIKLDSFRELMGRYRKENVATYSEMIVGLPGETYDSFADGLSELVDAGPGNSIHVYPCGIFPNSEMADSAYRERHGIVSVRSPTTIYHGVPAADPWQEWDELVVSTKTMPTADLLRCWRLAWVVQCFHCMGLTQSIAVFCRRRCGMSYRTFYERLADYAEALPSNTLLNATFGKIKGLYESLVGGSPWDFVDQRFGSINWPPEEGAFLTLMAKQGTLEWELEPFVKLMVSNDRLTIDLLVYQQAVLLDPFRPAGPCRFRVGWNLHEYIQSGYDGGDVELVKEQNHYEVIVPKEWPILEEWAKEVVWHGRKGLSSYQLRDVRNIGEAAEQEVD